MTTRTRKVRPRRAEPARRHAGPTEVALRRETALAGLQDLAARLNRWQAGEITNAAEAEALASVATIAQLADDVATAAGLFNAVANRIPIRLRIGVYRRRRQGRLEAQAGLEVDRGGQGAAIEALAADLIHLWFLFLWKADWRRFRRCGVCAAWFVDTTRSARQERCSAACARAWWTPERRAALGHKGYKPRKRK